MANIEINIESPVKYYDFKDQHGEILATLRFVPSDMGVYTRYEAVVEAFDRIKTELEELEKAGAEDKTKAAISPKIMKDYENQLKEKIDFLFNADTSKFFEIASPFTPMENGMMWAEVIIYKVIEIVKEVTGKSMAEVDKKVQQYTQKYKTGPGGGIKLAGK